MARKQRRYVDKNGRTIPQGSLSKRYRRPKSWHTNRERRLITSFGGKIRKGYGYDGIIKGKPIEVRSARKDNRFRIQENTHKELVRKGGSYIFDAPGHRPKKVSASRVSKMLPNGEWYKDRKYPHKFIRKKQIWK